MTKAELNRIEERCSELMTRYAMPCLDCVCEIRELYILLDQARTLLALSCPEGEITERIDAKLKEWHS